MQDRKMNASESEKEKIETEVKLRLNSILECISKEDTGAAYRKYTELLDSLLINHPGVKIDINSDGFLSFKKNLESLHDSLNENSKKDLSILENIIFITPSDFDPHYGLVLFSDRPEHQEKLNTNVLSNVQTSSSDKEKIDENNENNESISSSNVSNKNKKPNHFYDPFFAAVSKKLETKEEKQNREKQRVSKALGKKLVESNLKGKGLFVADKEFVKEYVRQLKTVFLLSKLFTDDMKDENTLYLGNKARDHESSKSSQLFGKILSNTADKVFNKPLPSFVVKTKSFLESFDSKISDLDAVDKNSEIEQHFLNFLGKDEKEYSSNSSGRSKAVLNILLDFKTLKDEFKKDSNFNLDEYIHDKIKDIPSLVPEKNSDNQENIRKNF